MLPKLTQTLFFLLFDFGILGVIYHQTITIALPIGRAHPEFPFNNLILIGMLVLVTTVALTVAITFILNTWAVDPSTRGNNQ